MTGVTEAHFAVRSSEGEVEDDLEHFKALPKSKPKISRGTSTVQETYAAL